MAASAAHVLAAEVTRAVRDTTTDAGEVREGDWIGLTKEGVRSIADVRRRAPRAGCSTRWSPPTTSS